MPLWVPQVTEAACLVAALLAGVGAGVYPDLGTAVKSAVCVERRFDPGPDSAVAYEERYRLYKQMYPTLIALQRQI